MTRRAAIRLVGKMGKSRVLTSLKPDVDLHNPTQAR